MLLDAMYIDGGWCYDSYQGSISGVDNRGNLTASLRDLFKELNKAGDGFPPLVFWQVNGQQS